LWLYFGIPLVLGLTISSRPAAVLALGLWSGAHLTEVFRGGIQSIEKTQHFAGYSLGMMPLQVARRVTLPQTFRRVLPPFISQFIVAVKYSSLVSVVGVVEITKRAEMAVVSTFRPLEIYMAAAVVYFVLLFAISCAGRYAEKILRVDALAGH
jgi:ABC-type amino acid transport system permease subunit